MITAIRPGEVLCEEIFAFAAWVFTSGSISGFKGVEGLVLKTDFDKELFVIGIELLQRSVAIKLEGFQISRL